MSNLKTQKTKDYLGFYHKKNKEEEPLFDNAKLKNRSENYAKIANHYYDLATDFYEYGWGSSFHFAYPFKQESYSHAITRLEYFLSASLGARKDNLLLDLGCGIGGPMRAIAQFSGAKIIGINNNEHQIAKGIHYNKIADLEGQCSFSKTNFMERLPFPDNTFDGVYSLEALCYAPDKVKVYQEILRVLKPKAYIAATDWCTTSLYDPSISNHVRLKEGIAKGNGLYDLVTTTEVLKAIETAGLKIISHQDLALTCEKSMPWYQPLQAKWSIKGFRRTTLGRIVTSQLVRILEITSIAPKGSTAVTHFLNEGADSLVQAGKLKIFTPGFFFLAQKD